MSEQAIKAMGDIILLVYAFSITYGLFMYWITKPKRNGKATRLDKTAPTVNGRRPVL